MVWIHGGGNTVGHAGFYDGGHLAEGENVVVVTINYRLGPFGWFRHAALRGDGTSDLERSGNFGILDQIRALEWVRDNIAVVRRRSRQRHGVRRVGGRAATSSRCWSRRRHAGSSIAPSCRAAASGPIRPPTAEGFVDDPVPSKPNASGEALIRLLIADGSASDRAAAKAKLAAMSPAGDRALPAVAIGRSTSCGPIPPDHNSELINLPAGVRRRGGAAERRRSSRRSWRADAHQHVPVMIGTNRDENKLFMFGDPAQVRWWLGIVPRLRDPAGYQIAAEYLARWWKATGADEPAQALSASQREPVFVYRFDWDEEPTILGSDFSQMLGAAHAFEVPFAFGHFDLGRDGNRLFTEDNKAGREALSAQMMGYWAQFARTGDPGRGTDGTSPAWLPWQGWPRYMVLDTPAGGGSRLSTRGRHPRVADRRRRRRSPPADPARQVPRVPDARGMVAELHARAVRQRRRPRLRRLSDRRVPLARLM